jgi:hypothetical protein
MGLIIGISIISIISAVLILRQAIRDADEGPEITAMYDNQYGEYDDAFISHKVDDNFKFVSLRKQLKDVEDKKNLK